MSKPSVLIVAYAFPPHSVVGAQRPMRMTKYLPLLTEWQPIVLSVKREFSRHDPSLLGEVPDGVPIYRAPSWEPLRWLERRQADKRSTPISDSRSEDPGQQEATPDSASTPRAFTRIKRLLLEVLSTPDQQLGWVPAALLAGLRIIRRHRPDVILVTAPPWSALIIGHLLSALTRIPWVADYRDPWTDIERGPLAPWRQRFERRLENRLLNNAAAVLSSSDHYTEIMRQRFASRPPGDFATIFNGFDEAKFALTPAMPDDLFTITHLGSLYAYIQPEPVFVGLRDWLAQDDSRRQKTRLQFIGRIDSTLRAMLARLDLQELTEETGFLPHHEAIERCRRTSILLLAMGITPLTPAGWMPSKLYEYLAFRRPILAFTVKGEAAAAIEQAGAGQVVSSQDPDLVVAALDRLVLQAQESTTSTATSWPKGISRFTQVEIMPSLAKTLDRARCRHRH